MRLIAQTYVSPLENQGTFNKVYVEDVSIIHKRNEKYISIGFEMYYIKNGKRIVLDFVEMPFLGAENDSISTNRTTIMEYLNPDYNKDVVGSQKFIITPLFEYLNKSGNVFPATYKIIDYGYPTYEKVMQYFHGGTLQNPEITITDKLAIGFLLNCLVINKEKVGKQFTFL